MSVSTPASSVSRIGRYEVRGELGRGSMGVVYEGYDPAGGRPVAIKVAINDPSHEAEVAAHYRRLFLNEAETAGKLRHPNILRILEGGVEDHLCYIVTELVRGGDTLRTYTRTDRLLPVERVVEILSKCADALDYAHRLGIVHRDVKPSNILLDPKLEVKLADFSIAHSAHPDLTRTMPLGFVGSPRYMSPEQLQEELVTHHSDLFSLGIVAYELLTGRHPFSADSFSSLVYRVVNEEPTPLSEFRRDVPASLERVVMRALAKHPQARHASGLDLLDELTGALSRTERRREDIAARERYEQVEALEFFRDFPRHDLWEVVRAGRWDDLAEGTRLLEEGEAEEGVRVLVSGRLALMKAGRVVEELGPGQCLGEFTFLRKAQRALGAVARTQARVVTLPPSLLDRLSQDSQLRFYKAFTAALARRLAARA